MKNTYFLCIILVLITASCGNYDDNFFEKYRGEEVKEEKTEESNFSSLIGKIDPNQTWRTSNMGQVTVNIPAEGEVNVYCEDDTHRLYLKSSKMKAGQKSFTINIPQHLAADVILYGYDENDNVIEVGQTKRSIIVEYKRYGVSETQSLSFDDLYKGIVVSFDSQTTRSNAATRAEESLTAVNEAPQKEALTGVANAKIYGYSTFPGDMFNDFASAIPEAKRASELIHNYEMISNGKFLVSMIYGCTGNFHREVGYYYYDENNPDNKTYIPFCDALWYDYFYNDDLLSNYNSKESAISKTQVKIGGLWYDVNYDHYDRKSPYNWPTGKTTREIEHKGDQSYLVLNVYDRQKKQIEEVRGITFLVDAPRGKKIGFYTTGPDFSKKNKTEYWKNHSEQQFNRTGTGLAYASVIRFYNDYRFIGIEDTTTPINKDKEPDCNDIAFVMVPGGNLPNIRLPYIIDQTEGAHKGMYYNGDGTWTEEPKKDILTDGVYFPSYSTEGVAEELPYESLNYWTFGFEDQGLNGDYDLNDVVIRVVENFPYEGKGTILLCAVGGTNNSDLYYKEEKIGEVHELLKITKGTMANTGKNTKTVDYQVVKIFDMPEGWNITENASDFYIISNGVESRLPNKNGQTPTAICAANDWQWPLENTRITESYPTFSEWSANCTTATDWYTKPSANSSFKNANDKKKAKFNKQ